MPTKRTTGSWVVRRSRDDAMGEAWLLGGPNDPGSIRSWFSWGGEESARVYPTKTAARLAIRGYRRSPGEVVEVLRSYGHEEGIR